MPEEIWREAANYRSKPGSKKAGEVFSSAAIILLPNAHHTERPRLKMRELSEGVFVVVLNDWHVAVNLTDSPALTKTFGQKWKITPLSVAVQNARSK